MKPIKKFVCLLLFSLPVLFLACSEDEELTPEELLMGTWTLSDQKFKIFANGTEIPEAMYPTFGIDPDSVQLFPNSTAVEFKSDNTFIFTTPDEDGIGNWTLSSDAKTLTITAADIDPLVFNVETLTANALNLTYSQEEDVDDGQGGTVNIKVDFQANFVK